ncbi:MAG: LPXTG cell wall anchor domain-containing protein, partial [Mycobacteriales bacterium]
PPDANAVFTDEVACDSQAISIGPVPGGSLCLPGTNYPRATKVVMHPLPPDLPTMANPCAGVPANPWCPAQVIASAGPAAGLLASGGTHDAAAPAKSLAFTGMNPALAWIGLSLLVGVGSAVWLRRRRWGSW